jgi:hypothetical protein
MAIMDIIAVVATGITATQVEGFIGNSLSFGKGRINKAISYLYDMFSIYSFNKHADKKFSDQVIFEDLAKYERKLEIAAENKDYTRINKFFTNIMDNYYKLSGISQIRASEVIEDTIVNYSKIPQMIKIGLFLIIIQHERFEKNWRDKHHIVYAEDGSGIRIPSYGFSQPIIEPIILKDNDNLSAFFLRKNLLQNMYSYKQDLPKKFNQCCKSFSPDGRRQ